ncbi:hypothetical protein [Sorangium cellulosum]|uniref:Uncharacterized protein n=1 Tax=Sorangium cellulosum So0157-2 TaxID=1254432 RepID=S4XVH5_SORCE|nr:hypothetical protein [Sorangium cellulosum]AGP35910.1 hypothetical protein SCE1572_16210 [Sorangium cellulosum So0157-2]
MAARMIQLSEQTSAHLLHVPTVTAWAPDAARAALPEVARSLEAALYEATGRRGIPVLAGWVLGHAAASGLMNRPDPATRDRVLIAEHPLRCAIFLDQNGRALSSEHPPRVLAGDPASLVDRLVALDSFRDPAFSLVALGRWGKALGRELGIPPIGRSMGQDLWIAPGRALIEEQWSETTVACVAADDVARCLRFAARKDIAVCFSASQPETAPPPLLADEAAGLESIYIREEHGRTARIDARPMGAGFVQRLERYGDVVDRREIAPRRVIVTSSPALKGASPRLARYAVSAPLGRAARLTSVEGLSTYLAEMGCRGWDVLLHVEAHFGGLIRESLWPGPPRMRLGPWLALRLAEELEAEGRGDSPDAEELSRAFPFLRWGEHELCLIGTLDQDQDLSIDPRGFVFLGDREIGQLSCLAQSVLGMLEKTALVDERVNGWGRLAALVVDRDLGGDFAEQAGTTRVDEASDVVSAHHVGELSWIHRVSELGPNRAETRIVARISEELVRLARLARELAPEAKLRVVTSSLEGQPRLAALHAAGLRDVTSMH